MQWIGFLELLYNRHSNERFGLFMSVLRVVILQVPPADEEAQRRRARVPARDTGAEINEKYVCFVS